MTEIGEMPERWDKTKFENICEFLDHKRVPIKLSDRNKRIGNIPYYGASGLAGWIDDYLFDEPLLLVAEDGENLVSRKLPIAYSINGKSWVNNHAHVLRFIGANRIFAEYFINSIDISPFLSGTTRPKLNKGSLMDIMIPFPDPKEQESIAQILRFRRQNRRPGARGPPATGAVPVHAGGDDERRLPAGALVEPEG